LSWFSFKANLMNRSISDRLINSMKIATTDEKITYRIEGYNLDEKKINDFRKKHANTILYLKNAIEQSDERAAMELESSLKTNVKLYERTLKKELMDIQKIIELSEKLVQNEHLSILYDLRKPRLILEHYKNKLASSVKNLALDNKSEREISQQFSELINEYENVIKKTILLCEQLQEGGTHLIKDSGGIIQFMEERAKIKRSLGGRYLVLINHILNLENYFINLTRKKLITREHANLILENISQFRTKFRQLMDLVNTRSNLSEILIKEAILIQKRKLEELEKLDKQISELAPKLKSDSNEILKKCRILISSLQMEDTKILRDEIIIAKTTENMLLIDESKLHSENISLAPLSSSKSFFNKMRKSAATISFILLSSFAANIGAPAVQAIKYDQKKGDKLLLVGTPEHISKYLQVYGDNIPASSIEKESQPIINYEKLYSFNRNKYIIFNLSEKLDNSEGIANLAEFQSEFQNSIKKALLDSINSAKIKLHYEFPNTDISDRELDKIFDESAVSNITLIPSRSSITGYICPEEFILEKKTGSQNKLDELRARKTAEILQDILKELRLDLSFNYNADSLSQIQINGAGAIFKQSKVHLAVNNLNDFTYNKVDSTVRNKFFRTPDFLPYSKYNNRKGLLINYQRFSSGNTQELLKFDIAKNLMKFASEDLYEEHVKNVMMDLRRCEIELSFKISIKVFGSTKTLIMTSLALADLPTRKEKTQI
jgi:hypothetical protein